MNRQELITKIAEKTGVSSKETEKVVAAFMDTVKQTVASGDTVQLVGFGTFERRDRAARTARNPQTGAALTIAAKKTPAFKPGKAFKDAVNA